MKKGQQDAVVDLDLNKGFAQMRLDGHKDRYTQTGDFVSLELRGFSAEEQQRIYQVRLEGVQ